jgi:hypothetical protein
MNKLTVVIKHKVAGDKYEVKTDLNNEGLKEILDTFLRSQMGQGADNRKANKRSIYTIKLTVDLTDDTVVATDDCGNKGLRDGILLCFLKTLK